MCFVEKYRRLHLFGCFSSQLEEPSGGLEDCAIRGVKTVCSDCWWMNGGDGQQIALRHTGELVKEAAEKDNGRFFSLLSAKGDRTKKRSERAHLTQ